jgi:hypothetical protein
MINILFFPPDFTKREINTGQIHMTANRKKNMERKFSGLQYH